MRPFSTDRTYDVPPRRIVTLWRDPAFLAEVGRRYGGTGEPEIAQEGDRTVVRRARQLPLEQMPGALRKLLKGGTIVQVDSWPTDPGDGVVTGTWSVDGRGIPASMSGTQRVEPAAAGCRVVVEGQVSVQVPIVGGRAEEAAASQIGVLVGREQELAAQWLADHPEG